MVFLNLSHNITKFRREKGITQEALAEFAGVTKASVSKWETGSTMPDIQLLPLLASFFDRSVDELLGYEAQLSERQIRYYYHDLKQKFVEQGFDVVWEESQKLIKQYYSCYLFLMQLAILWLNHSALAPTPEKRNEALTLVEHLCNRILENSEEMGLCENARSLRAMVWIQQERQDMVIDSMEEEVFDINRVGDKSDLLFLAYMTSGERKKAQKCAQISLYRQLMETMGQLTSLLMTMEGNEAFNREVIRRGDQLLKCFAVDKLQPNAAAGFHYQAALVLASELADHKENIDAEQFARQEAEVYTRLSFYVQMIQNLYQDGIKLHSDEFFYELKDWFEQLDIGPEGIRDSRVILTDAMASLQHPAFSILTDVNRMNQLKRILQSLE